jgi:lipoprotein NlpI/tRNA A-37 threonylcarbamoyl transferase component Bud32
MSADSPTTKPHGEKIEDGTVDLRPGVPQPELDPRDGTIDVAPPADPGSESGTIATIDVPAGAPAEADATLGTVDLPGGPPPGSESGTIATIDVPGGPPAADAPYAATLDAPPAAAPDADAAKWGTIAPSEQAPAAPSSQGLRSSGSGSVRGTNQRRFDRTGAASAGAFLPVAPEVESKRYVLKKFHAKGGMGEIWLAEDSDLGRPVALKKIRGNPTDEQKDQFLREAQITGQLEHPGVVPVHELSADEAGQPFYTMKFIQGRTLTDVIGDYHAKPPRGDQPREVQGLRLLQVFLNICQTVAYAHSRGVIHRDLKPDNVMVGAYGETLLLDWGLAKPMGVPEEETASIQVRSSYSGETLETEDGAIKGTGSYMSPEVAAGCIADVDQVSDVFLLGGTLYHILTGKRPREAKRVSELIMKAINETPTPPRKLDPTIPKSLDAICVKALALNRKDRYQTAAAMAEDVQRHLAGEPVAAYRENVWERAWRWAKRHRVAITRTVAAVAVAAVIGVVAYAFQQFAEKSQRDIDEANKRQQEAQREADELAAKEQAGKDVKEFRKLAAQTQLYTAFQDPGAEHVPYYDPEQGAATAKAALAKVSPWGPKLEGLPVAEDRAPLRKELYDLLLLLAQSKGRGAGPAAAKEVLALLDQAAPLREPTVSYHRLRGAAYQALGEKEKAAAEQRRADDPKTPALAVDYYLAGERLRTGQAAQAGEKKDAATQATREQLNQAIEQYRKALVQEQNHYWSHFQLGQCYLSLGQSDMAIEALGACVALQPESPWGYMMRGLVLGLAKRYPDALADLDKAVDLAPDFRPPRLNRGIVNWRWEKDEAALADFDRALRPPDDQRLLEAAYYRGQLHLLRGELDSALKDFRLATSEKRGVREAHLRSALIHFVRKDFKAGLAEVTAFVEWGKAIDARSAEGLELRGRRLYALENELPQASRTAVLELALADLEAAVEKGRRSAVVFDYLGMAREQLGKEKPAIAAYTDALKYAPKDVKLLTKRAWLHVGLEQYDAALADFNGILKLEPKYAEAHAGIGYVQACQGKDPAAATRQAAQALLDGSTDYLALHNIACVYGKLSEKLPARAREYQDLALTCLQREVELWLKDRRGPNPYVLIRGDSALQTLRERPEFVELLKEKK